MRNERRFALILIAALATTIFLPALVSRHVPQFRDHTDYFQPLRWFTASELRAGNLPLWNPYSASGEPWLANPQTGVFYPPQYLFVVLPFETAYVLFLVFHLALVGWGAWMLFARLASPGAALVGAVGLMFSGPVMSLLDINNNLATFAWIPLVILCGIERRPLAGAVTLALAFLGGEPFFAACAAAMFVVARLAVGERQLAVDGRRLDRSAVGGRRLAVEDPMLEERGDEGLLPPTANRQPPTDFPPTANRQPPTDFPPTANRQPPTDFPPTADRQPPTAFRDIVLAALGAFGLTAVQLLPFLEWVRSSDRAEGLDAAELFRDAMPLGDWMHLATFPGIDRGGFDPRLGQHFIPIVYVGVVIVLFAAVGALLRFRKAWPWLVLLALAVIVGSGPSWLASLPVTLFRYPARMVPLGALALAAMAALGVERLRIDRRWVVLLLVFVVVADLVPRSQPLLRHGKFRKGGIPYPAVVGADAKILRIDEVPTHRSRWIAGYTNLYDRRFDAFTAAPLVDSDYLRGYEALLVAPTARALAEQSVGWVLTQRRLQRPFQRAARRGEVNLYRFNEALPIARFESGGATMPLAFETGTSRASVRVDAAQRGRVVLAQRDGPGWSVSVDGGPARMSTKHAFFRAIDVEPGRHRVVWTYRPRALFAGAVITFATLVTMLFSFVVKHSRREKFFFLSHKS